MEHIGGLGHVGIPVCTNLWCPHPPVPCPGCGSMAMPESLAGGMALCRKCNHAWNPRGDGDDDLS